MSKNDGGPAFPGQLDHSQNLIESWTGMTLRDYAAIKFVAAWCSALAMRHREYGYTDITATEQAVRLGNLQADTFITNRAKESP